MNLYVIEVESIELEKEMEKSLTESFLCLQLKREIY